MMDRKAWYYTNNGQVTDKIPKGQWPVLWCREGDSQWTRPSKDKIAAYLLAQERTERTQKPRKGRTRAKVTIED